MACCLRCSLQSVVWSFAFFYRWRSILLSRRKSRIFFRHPQPSSPPSPCFISFHLYVKPFTHAGFASKHANMNFVLNSAKLASKQNLQIAKEHSHNQTWMGKRILPAIKKYAGLKGVRNTNLAWWPECQWQFAPVDYGWVQSKSGSIQYKTKFFWVQ